MTVFTGPWLNAGETNPAFIVRAVQQLAERWDNPPTTVTASYTMLQSDTSIICNGSGTITLTLLNPATVAGRILLVKTITAQAVNSASSNVVPIGSTTAGTAILTATASNCSVLQSDGTNWVTLVNSAPAAAGGSVNGPVSSTVGDIALWNNTTGTLLSDSGIAITTTAQYLANTASKALTTDQVWAAAPPTTLTDGVTVTPDLSLGINFKWTIAGNRTLANPTNQKIGQTGYIKITQDATGGRTIATWGTNYVSAGGSKPILSTAASAVDVLYYEVIDTSQVLVSIVSGVA